MNHDDEIDCSGIDCPLPVLKTKITIDTIATGAVLRVTTTDPRTCKDMPAWVGR